jgi:transcription initiation factor TFIIF subunit alpha
MAKKSQPPRWLMKHLHPENENDDIVAPARKRLRTVDGQQRAIKKREDDDADELDFDEEFDDDEEAPIMEGPEDESKEAEVRIL